VAVACASAAAADGPAATISTTNAVIMEQCNAAILGGRCGKQYSRCGKAGRDCSAASRLTP